MSKNVAHRNGKITLQCYVLLIKFIVQLKIKATMKLNILFISIDSLRFDKIFGKNKSVITPNIDKIIKNGVVFNQTISSGTLIAYVWIVHLLLSFQLGRKYSIQN
jgi:hypothetical protein